MNQRIFAFVLLFSLVSPLTFQSHQTQNHQFTEKMLKQSASALTALAKSLQTLSAKICKDGYSVGNTIGVTNILVDRQTMKLSGRYSQSGKLLYYGEEQIKPQMSSLWPFSKIAKTASGSSGCMVFQILPNYGSLVIQYDNSWSQGSFANICIRTTKFNAQTCFKNLNVYDPGCLKFKNPYSLKSSASKESILQFQGFLISVNVNFSIVDGCRVQEIAVVMK